MIANKQPLRACLPSHAWDGETGFTYVNVTYANITRDTNYHVWQNHNFHMSNWVHPLVLDVIGVFGHSWQISQNPWTTMWN